VCLGARSRPNGFTPIWQLFSQIGGDDLEFLKRPGAEFGFGGSVQAQKILESVDKLNFPIVNPAQRIGRTNVQNGELIVFKFLGIERVLDRDLSNRNRQIQNGIEQTQEVGMVFRRFKDLFECEIVDGSADSDGHGHIPFQKMVSKIGQLLKEVV
jgi:hypothetical protein